MYKKSKNSLIIGKPSKNPLENSVHKNSASKGGFFLHIKKRFATSAIIPGSK